MKEESPLIIGTKIGGGTFGTVYKARDKNIGEEVALKVETEKANQAQISHEYRYYKYLGGGIGIPKAFSQLSLGNRNCFVMELLGNSLESLFHMCKKSFSLKTVLMIADQAISRLQYIHEKGIIHKDVKPDNFVVGLNEKANTIYIIDFGLSKRYIDLKTRAHIPYREGRNLTGTSRYASTYNHMGIEQSRRDDMESLAYLLIYLLKGSLPWQDKHFGDKKENIQRIGQIKISTTVDSLCLGIPREFGEFLKATRSLDFAERPNYEMYREMFRNLFIRSGFVYDYNYDWTTVQTAEEMCLSDDEKANALEETSLMSPPDMAQPNDHFMYRNLSQIPHVSAPKRSVNLFKSPSLGAKPRYVHAPVIPTLSKVRKF